MMPPGGQKVHFVVPMLAAPTCFPLIERTSVAFKAFFISEVLKHASFGLAEAQKS